MRAILQILALALMVGTLAWWTAAGTHRGWTQTEIPYQESDPITEITVTRYRKGFVPGVEILVLGCGTGAALLILTLIFKPQTRTPSSP
jgi:hypothetical protein